MVPPRLLFGTVLVVTMASATFAFTVFSVLASELIAAMRIERWQVGMLVTAATLGGALFSPMLGKWTDAVGGRRAINTTLVIAGVVLFCVGIAPEFSLIVGAAFLTGLAMAISNPATNKLISAEIEPGERGFIVGVKQSGALFNVAIGGLLLPLFTIWWGWRWAVIAFAVIPLAVAAPYMVKRTGPDPVVAASDGAMRKKVAKSPVGRLPRWIRRLMVYGFLMGAGITAVLTYLSLFAQEVLGMSQGQAGLAVSVSGWVGILSLIGWVRLAEGRLGAVRSLMIIAWLGAVLGIVLAYGHLWGTWTIWLASVLTGLSGSAWNAVSMLVVIQGLSESLTGRGSGVILAGALGGSGLGAPLFGWSVDVLGVYTPGWLVVAALFTVGFGVMCTVRGEFGLPTPISSGV